MYSKFPGIVYEDSLMVEIPPMINHRTALIKSMIEHIAKQSLRFSNKVAGSAGGCLGGLSG